MYDYINDADYAHDHYIEQIDKAENCAYHRPLQPKQPNMLNRLQNKIADWAQVITQQQSTY